jgi:hypothetical protein
MQTLFLQVQFLDWLVGSVILYSCNYCDMTPESRNSGARVDVNC